MSIFRKLALIAWFARKVLASKWNVSLQIVPTVPADLSSHRTLH